MPEIDWSRPIQTESGKTALLIDREDGAYPMVVMVVAEDAETNQRYTPEGIHSKRWNGFNLRNVGRRAA